MQLHNLPGIDFYLALFTLHPNGPKHGHGSMGTSQGLTTVKQRMSIAGQSSDLVGPPSCQALYLLFGILFAVCVCECIMIADSNTEASCLQILGRDATCCGCAEC